MSLISGAIYFLLLLAVTAIFLKGEYEGVGVTLFVVASGAILSAITGNSAKNRTRKRIRKKRTW
jgi:dolichol kinase